MTDIISETNRVKAGDLSNTPEEARAAMRKVCGARACRGAEDAKFLLIAIGLLQDPETAQPRVRQHKKKEEVS